MRNTSTYTGRGWDERQVKQLLLLHSQGKHVKDMVPLLGKSKSAIHSKLIYMGLYRNRSTCPKELEEAVLKRLREGQSQVTIRRALGVSYPRVKRIQREHSVDTFSSPPLALPQAAYLAGIIDGEGCIMLSQHKGITMPRVIISVSNTHFGLIDYLRKMSGCGSVSSHPKKGNRRPQQRWAAYQRCAIELIRKIRPYMICKAAQADAVCEYYDKYVVNHPWECSDEEKSSIVEMVERLHKLNKRGVH